MRKKWNRRIRSFVSLCLWSAGIKGANRCNEKRWWRSRLSMDDGGRRRRHQVKDMSEWNESWTHIKRHALVFIHLPVFRFRSSPSSHLISPLQIGKKASLSAKCCGCARDFLSFQQSDWTASTRTNKLRLKQLFMDISQILIFSSSPFQNEEAKCEPVILWGQPPGSGV